MVTSPGLRTFTPKRMFTSVCPPASSGAFRCTTSIYSYWRLYIDSKSTGASFRSIQKNPNDPSFFNNRALVRIKLEQWEGAEHDARIAIDLFGPKNSTAIKSNYYLSQALLGLQRPAEALDVALAAYKASIEIKNPNAEPLSRVILRAKQAIWAASETTRLRNQDETLRKWEELLQADYEKELSELRASLAVGEIGQIGFEEDKKDLLDEMQRRLGIMRNMFAASKGADMKERVCISCSPPLAVAYIQFWIPHVYFKLSA